MMPDVVSVSLLPSYAGPKSIAPVYPYCLLKLVALVILVDQSKAIAACHSEEVKRNQSSSSAQTRDG